MKWYKKEDFEMEDGTIRRFYKHPGFMRTVRQEYRRCIISSNRYRRRNNKLKVRAVMVLKAAWGSWGYEK